MIKEVIIEQDYKNLEEYLTEEDVTLVCVYPTTHVNYGIDGDCDIEWCVQNGVPVHDLRRSGGCIVQAGGSIGLFDVRKTQSKWLDEEFLEDFRDYLIGRGLDATIDRNDIMVDGHKVASGSGMNLPPDFNRQFTCWQIAVYVDMYVIENACLKPMVKHPKGLNDYGITTEEVKQWCIDWFCRKEKI